MLYRTRPHLYTTRAVHSQDYYLRLLLVLIDGLNAGETHAQTADRLNHEDILSPQGLAFTPANVKEAYKKLRLSADYPSRLYTAMLALIVSGQLTADQCKPLISMRSGVM
jgi:hypothetical protein